MSYEWKSEYQDQIKRRGDAADQLYRDKGRVLISGHRGVRALLPENTIPSFERALQMGVDSLEMDVNMTKDHIAVVCHDNTLNRTTNGTGYIHDYTLEEIQAMDAGCRFGNGEFAGKGYKIPTLAEFAALLEPWHDIQLNVEIKEMTFETVDQTMATFGAFHMLDRCVFTSFDASVLHYMADSYGVKTQGFVGRIMDNFREGKNGTYEKMYAVGLGMNDLTKESVRFFESIGVLAWCWCPDDEEAVKYALSCGARLMTCNDPRAALKYIKHLDNK